MSETKPALPELRGYHAHVYSTVPEHGRELEPLRARASEELHGARIGTLHHEPVGPHTRPMFQIAFERAAIVAVLPWLIAHRGAHSVLIHPLVGDALREHTRDALWLGEPLAIDVEVFDGAARESARHTRPA